MLIKITNSSNAVANGIPANGGYGLWSVNHAASVSVDSDGLITSARVNNTATGSSVTITAAANMRIQVGLLSRGAVFSAHLDSLPI